MKPHPEVIELDYDDLQAKLNQIEATMGAELARPFRQLLGWYATLVELLRAKTISIQRLRKMLFGSSTERTSAVLPAQTSATDTAVHIRETPVASVPQARCTDSRSGRLRYV